VVPESVSIPLVLSLSTTVNDSSVGSPASMVAVKDVGIRLVSSNLRLEALAPAAWARHVRAGAVDAPVMAPPDTVNTATGILRLLGSEATANADVDIGLTMRQSLVSRVATLCVNSRPDGRLS